MKVNEGTIDRVLRVIARNCGSGADRAGRQRNSRGMGLYWRGSVADRPDRYLPGLCHLRHTYLPDEKNLT